MSATDDRERAIDDLTRTTAMTRDQAAQALDAVNPARGLVGSEAWIDEPRWRDAVEKSDTVAVEVFMGEHHLDRNGLRELLREYRQEGGYSPFEYGQRDELGADFLNWHEWERLA